MGHYKHTQVGWLTIGCVVGFLLVVQRGIAGADSTAGYAIAVTLVLALLLLFAALTVTVDRTSVKLRFGIGLIRKRLPLSRIRTFRAVRNHWYYGWGIKMVPDGWMWNIAGLSAVELALENGRIFRIGTDEPEALVRALEAATGTPPSSGSSTTN